MITKVMNMARLARIWLGGMAGVPMAWRRKWKTMMIRVKDVTVNMMAGARERTVSRKMISRSRETFSGSLWPPARLMVRVGMFCASAGPARASNRMTLRLAVARRDGRVHGLLE